MTDMNKAWPSTAWRQGAMLTAPADVQSAWHWAQRCQGRARRVGECAELTATSAVRPPRLQIKPLEP